jgi:hypothetical protein
MSEKKLAEDFINQAIALNDKHGGAVPITSAEKQDLIDKVAQIVRSVRPTGQ